MDGIFRSRVPHFEPMQNKKLDWKMFLDTWEIIEISEAEMLWMPVVARGKVGTVHQKSDNISQNKTSMYLMLHTVDNNLGEMTRFLCDKY